MFRNTGKQIITHVCNGHNINFTSYAIILKFFIDTLEKFLLLSYSFFTQELQTKLELDDQRITQEQKKEKKRFVKLQHEIDETVRECHDLTSRIKVRTMNLINVKCIEIKVFSFYGEKLGFSKLLAFFPFSSEVVSLSFVVLPRSLSLSSFLVSFRLSEFANGGNLSRRSHHKPLPDIVFCAKSALHENLEFLVYFLSSTRGRNECISCSCQVKMAQTLTGFILLWNIP